MANIYEKINKKPTAAKMKASPAKNNGNGDNDKLNYKAYSDGNDYYIDVEGNKVAVDVKKATKYTPPVTTPAGDAAYAALSQEERDAQDAKYIAANTKDYFTFLKKQNTTSTPGSTKKTTTTTTIPGDPGTQDYNMGWRQTQNANAAEAAQRRGNRRAARRATRDTWKNMTKAERKEARENKKTLRQNDGLKKGRLNKRMQMINETMDTDLRNANVDAARIKLGENVDLSNTSQAYQDRVRSSTVSKHSSALNKYGPKGPDNVTTVVTGDEGTGEPPTTTNVLRPSVEGSTAIDDLVFSNDDKGSSGNGNIFSNMKLNPDNYKIQGDYSTGAMISRALQNNPIGVTPSASNLATDQGYEVLDERTVRENIAIKNPINKNKPAYNAKSSGILKKGHHRGAGY